MNNYLIFGLGFFAQALFFIRTIAQWFKSEKEGEVISPVIYWQISLLASFMMVIYGIFRNDFAIVLGQFIVYFIYIRNLQLKNAWKTMPGIARAVAILLPFIIISWLIFGESHNFRSILKNEDVSTLLLIWGSAGQIIFTFRFIYQWIYSENRKDSFLPLGFWIISTVGSLMIFAYSIYRVDPVLFVSHSLGLFIYVRNILLHYGKNSIFSTFSKMPFIEKVIDKVSDKIK
ncbi:MAG: lipid-A-disaccharide synthase N-terminal domain-containing protein [Prolixibacteraceae bacterium]|nr:lipid-A-disaccharide synthase N-terminal domain-containing protein [Prolixibacteraceae bacterium]